MIANEVWVPLAAAFGASMLTGGVLLLSERNRDRRRAREELRESRVRAYSRLLAVTGVIVFTAQTLRLTMQHHSGWADVVALALRFRKFVGPFDVDNRLRRDLVPLYEAWADVLTLGSPEAVDIANDAVQKAGAVMAAAVRHRQDTVGRLQGAVVGVRWSDADRQQWQGAVRELARVRRDLAALARRELGVEAAAIFPDDPPRGEGSM